MRISHGEHGTPPIRSEPGLERLANVLSLRVVGGAQRCRHPDSGVEHCDVELIGRAELVFEVHGLGDHLTQAAAGEQFPELRVVGKSEERWSGWNIGRGTDSRVG